jgi:hypothetical protein
LYVYQLANPHYTPEISTKATVVNFAVKKDGLEAQLLGIVVQKEEPNLEKQKSELVIRVAAGKRQLVELEDQILKLLSESTGSLLVHTLHPTSTFQIYPLFLLSLRTMRSWWTLYSNPRSHLKQ